MSAEAMKLVVFGGNGFVGSAICKEAIRLGSKVISVSRSGRPAWNDDWLSKVEWLKGDALKPEEWKDELKGSQAVISCVGAFGSNQQMRRVNGEANVTVVNAAAEEGVGRFVFISAHDFGFPRFVLKGYYEGKRATEAAITQHFPSTGVFLQPGMIHGSRRVGSITLPLSLVGLPLEAALTRVPWASRLPLIGPALIPAVSVTAVARTAVRAATDDSFPSGACGVWEILKQGA